MSKRKQIGYSLILWETLKEYNEETKWFEPTKNKRVEVAQMLSEEMSDNEEVKSLLIDKLFGYKDDIKEMIIKGDYHEIPSYHKESLEKDQKIAILEEQLSNAIIPKFKIGQEVWFLNELSEEIYVGIVVGFEVSKVYSSPLETYYRIEYEDGCLITDDFEDEFVFATEEEAQAKLEELKNE